MSVSSAVDDLTWFDSQGQSSSFISLSRLRSIFLAESTSSGSNLCMVVASSAAQIFGTF